MLWLFWFTSVVLYASYTAILTSFLTVSTVTPPFTTLDEAVSAPGWKIGLLKGTATPKILQVVVLVFLLWSRRRGKRRGRRKKTARDGDRKNNPTKNYISIYKGIRRVQDARPPIRDSS